MIRPFADKDLEAIKKIHAEMGLDYELPRKFFSLVLANEKDEPEQALLFRPTAEMFLLMDHSAGLPVQRWVRFLNLHEEMRKFALNLGLYEVEAFLPPEIEKRFGARLKSIGWERNLWACFTRNLSIPTEPKGGK